MTNRTIVYVDGFNFYYGSLKGTKYKWLDLLRFAREVLPLPKNDVIKGRWGQARSMKYLVGKASKTASREVSAALQEHRRSDRKDQVLRFSGESRTALRGGSGRM